MLLLIFIGLCILLVILYEVIKFVLNANDAKDEIDSDSWEEF